MVQRTLLITSLLLLLALTGCRVVNGSGDVVTDERSIDDIDGIQLSIDAELTIVQGDSTFLTIKGEDNIIEQVETEVRRGVLIIGTRNRGVMTILRNTEPIEIKVSTPTLESIAISGSGNADAAELEAGQLALEISGSGDIRLAKLNADELDVGISGSGNVDIDELSASTIDVNISGSGDVSMEGQADKADLNISGSGEVKAGGLAVGTADVRVSGSGSIVTWAREALDIRISGSGEVSYYGTPQLDQDISGSGDIESLGEKE